MQLSLFVTLLLRLLVACSTLQFCLTAPTNATVSRDLFKRGYVPTDQQCDDALKNNNFDGKAMFYTGDANPGPWRTKLGHKTVTNAYGGAYLSVAPSAPGPLAGVNDINDPLYKQIWGVLSAGFARATEGDTYIAMDPGQVADPQSLWVTIEVPILMKTPGRRIFLVNAQDTNAIPLQIWPPGVPGGPMIPNSQ